MSEESKAQKFARLYPKRLANATKSLELLANLGRSSYQSSPEALELIRQELEEALDKVDRSLRIQTRQRPHESVSPGGSQCLVLPAAIRDGAPVEGYDRAAIRRALTIRDPAIALRSIRKVVLGWTPAAWDREKHGER